MDKSHLLAVTCRGVKRLSRAFLCLFTIIEVRYAVAIHGNPMKWHDNPRTKPSPGRGSSVYQ